MRKKEFLVDQPIDVIQNYSIHIIDEHILLIQPIRPTWIVLSKEEFLIYQEMQKKKHLSEILRCFNHVSVNNVLTKVEYSDFYDWFIKAQSSEKKKPDLTLYLTEKCNLKCVHCYVNESNKENYELNENDWFKIIDTYRERVDYGEVFISGGEPTLCSQLSEILKKIKKMGFNTSLYSNGTLYNNRSEWDELLPNLDHIYLSMDGFSPECHDNIRGLNSFKKLESTLTYLYSKNIIIHISICVVPQNICDIKTNLIPFLFNHDPDQKFNIIFSPTIKMGRNLGEYSTWYPDIENQLGPLLDTLSRNGWTIPPFFSMDVGKKRCGFGQHIHIRSNGDIQLCKYSQKYANIKEINLWEWYDKIYEDFDELDVDNNFECQNCDIRYVCLGDCIILKKRNIIGPCDNRIKNCYISKIIKDYLRIFPKS